MIPNPNQDRDYSDVKERLAMLTERVAGFIESQRLEMQRQGEWRGEISGSLLRQGHDLQDLRDKERDMTTRVNALQGDVTHIKDDATKNVKALGDRIDGLNTRFEGTFTVLRGIWITIGGFFFLVGGIYGIVELLKALKVIP